MIVSSAQIEASVIRGAGGEPALLNLVRLAAGAIVGGAEPLAHFCARRAEASSGGAGIFRGRKTK